MHREGMEQGLRGVAAGVAPPADVLDEHGRAVHAQHQPGVRRADGRHARRAASAAYADPAWRDRVRGGLGHGPQGGIPPRWETYEIMESTAQPELIGRRLLGRSPTSAGADPFDLLLDLAVAEPTLKDIRVKAVAGQRRRGRRGHAAPGGRLHARPVRRRRPRQPAVRRPAGHRPARPAGCARRACSALEQAVHKLTQVQADLFGFAGRGVLARGLRRRPRRVRSRHRGPRPAAPGQRLPGRRRAPDRRPARGHAPPARQRRRTSSPTARCVTRPSPPGPVASCAQRPAEPANPRSVSDDRPVAC